MYCDNCGFKLQPEDSFCGECGTPIKDGNIDQQDRLSIKKSVVVAGIEELEKERQEIHNEKIKNEYKEQQQDHLLSMEGNSQARDGLFNFWHDKFIERKRIILIITTIFVFFIFALMANELWKNNIKFKEDELRLAEEHIQLDEIHRKLEDEQVKGLDRIADMEKHLSDENAQMDEARRRAEHEQPRAAINSIQTNSSASVQPPKIQVGDIYIYEYIDTDNPASSTKTKRTVISNGDKVVLSLVNINAIDTRKRTLYFNHEWNLIGTRNAGNTGFDYSPPLKYFDFPLYPGKTWQQTTTETNIKTGATRTHRISGTVDKWESISVPAGAFNSIKIILKSDLIDPATNEIINGTDISWYAPDIRRTVKTMATGKNGKSQLIQLISYEVK